MRNNVGPWKVWKPNGPYDINTLSYNTTRLEATVLCSITKLMMTSNNSIMVNSNDGSEMSGVGSYAIQYVNINEKQRTLPTMSFFLSLLKA